jgi:4-amino-4-deoxy-L-arabinose transferase-like glycosyltransferase
LAVFGVLLLFAGIIAAQRLHTYHEPLDRDTACYAVIGHEFLQGRKLYTDLWDHKPPAVYITFAAFELLAGYSRRSIFALNVTFAVLTLLGVYAAGRADGGAAGGGTAGGLWAAAFWTVICGDLFLEANQPNTEVMINACLIWAFALMVRSEEKPRRPSYWLGIGGLFALASLYKHITVVTPAALAVVHLLFARRKRGALGQTAAIALVGVAAWAIAFGYFAADNRLGDFVGAVFRYNVGYAGDQGENVSRGLDFPLLVPPYLRFAWPLALLTLAALVLLARKSPRAFGMLAALILAAAIEVLLPGKFFAHYYQFWMPVLCVGGAWGITWLASRLPSRTAPAAHLAGAAALALLMMHEAPFYRLPATEWARLKCGGRPVSIEMAALAREIDGMLAPEETFFVWGNAPELYYYTRRPPPYAALFTDPIRQGPMVEKISNEILMDIDRSPPELFVAQLDETVLGRLTDHPVPRWFVRRYQPLPDRPFRYGYALFYRTGGALEHRLNTRGREAAPAARHK